MEVPADHRQIRSQRPAVDSVFMDAGHPLKPADDKKPRIIFRRRCFGRAGEDCESFGASATERGSFDQEPTELGSFDQSPRGTRCPTITTDKDEKDANKFLTVSTHSTCVGSTTEDFEAFLADHSWNDLWPEAKSSFGSGSRYGYDSDEENYRASFDQEQKSSPRHIWDPRITVARNRLGQADEQMPAISRPTRYPVPPLSLLDEQPRRALGAR